MGPFAVVDPQPGVGQRSEFCDRLEEMRIEDFSSVAAMEAFDVRVLLRFARLDVMNRSVVFGAPVDEGLGREFGAVVDTERGRAAMAATSSSRTRITRRLGGDNPIAISKPSRFPSSIIVSKRTRRPS
jgi:hypothetical protein